MKGSVTKAEARKLIGKRIYVIKKDGARVSGILRGIRGNRLLVELPRDKNKASTKGFILPLVLFDLLVIATRPFGGCGFGGCGGVGGFGGLGGLGGGFGKGFGRGFGKGFGLF